MLCAFFTSQNRRGTVDAYEHPEIIKHAPPEWKAAQQESSGNEKTIDEEDSEVSDRTSRKAWARLLTKVYEIDHMVCPKSGSEMRVIAVIRDISEIRKILKHLRKIGRPPPGVDFSSINYLLCAL